jgi:hypothetical protein
MLCKDTARILKGFKANHPEMFARLKAYKQWCPIYDFTQKEMTPADWKFVTSGVEVIESPKQLGICWYVKVLGKDLSVLNHALQISHLLTPELPYSWFVEVFGYDAHELADALRAAGKLTAEPGRDWYVQHFSNVACVDYDAYDEPEWTPEEYLFNRLQEAGVLNRDAAVEWYVKVFGTSKQLMPALKAAGYLPDLDLDWYVKTFKHSWWHDVSGCWDLLDAIIYAEVEPDFAWIVMHLSPNEDSPFIDEEDFVPLLAAIEHYNMQAHVKDLGYDWCASVLAPPERLWTFLRDCSMLTTEPGKEWYETTFGSNPGVLKQVLRDAGF